MPNVDDTVIFNPADGRTAVEAVVTAVGDDETINLIYPHPKAPDVMATAEGVQPGNGAFQYREGDIGAAQGEQPAINQREFVEKLQTEIEVLHARIDVLQPLADSADPDALAAKDAELAELREAHATDEATIGELKATAATREDDLARITLELAAALEAKGGAAVGDGAPPEATTGSAPQSVADAKAAAAQAPDDPKKK